MTGFAADAVVHDEIATVHDAIRAGDLHEAMRICNKLLIDDPTNADLYFERGFTARLHSNIDQAEHDFRACLKLFPDHVRAMEQLGRIVRRERLATATDNRPSGSDSSEPGFIYAIGSSYVRAFSSTTLFFPLWLGTASDLSFLTPERAARTTSHLFAAIDRCDLRNSVLLVMGNNDAIAYEENISCARPAESTASVGSHSAILEEATLRYVHAIESILLHYPDIMLAVLGGCVMLSRKQSNSVRFINRILATQCRRLSIPFIDLNDQLTDPHTCTLRLEYASHPEDTHLSKKASVELTRQRFIALGSHYVDEHPFEWTYLWQAPLSGDFSVRIWGEPHTGPSNLTHSRTVAFNHVVNRALLIFLGILALHDPSEMLPSILVPYCREGFVPLSIPPNRFSKATGCDSDPAAILMAQRLYEYFKGANTSFHVATNMLSLRTGTEPHDYIFVALRDEIITDVEAFLDELLSLCKHCLVVLSTLDWSVLTPVVGYSRLVIPIADAVTRPPWDAATILIVRRTIRE